MSRLTLFRRLTAVTFIVLLFAISATSHAQRRAPDPPRGGGSGEQVVPGFGHVEGTPIIPGFGEHLDTGVTLTEEDFERADRRLRDVDRNRDGFIDREEARRARWSDDPFEYDLDRDHRLSRTELAHRYAVRRMREAAARSEQRSSTDASSGRRSSSGDARDDREQRDEGSSRRSGEVQPTRDSWHLADTLMRRHDRDRDGYLDASERRSMGLNSLAADTNRDYRISRRELAVWLADQQLERSRILPPELPAWFFELDRDGDGQVSMAEFSNNEEWTDERLSEFMAYDANNDGFIEPAEVLRAMERSRHQYANERFTLIPNRGVTRSEIEIDETARITNVNVVLGITHTYVGHLKGFLVGPEGQRVELFANVGGSDDHFEETILDEEAPSSIRSGRPPFSGRYHTSDRSRGRPGLRQFYGHPMNGTWTLLIEADSNRPGALHRWALVFEKEDDDLSDEDDMDDGDDPPPMDDVDDFD